MKKYLVVPAVVLMLTAFQQSSHKNKAIKYRPDSIITIRIDKTAVDGLKNDVSDISTSLSELNSAL